MSRISIAMALSAAILLPAAGAAAVEHDHGAHDSTATLELNAGAKWQTDPPLRAAMAALRDDVAASMEPIHEKKFTAAQYKELAGKVESRLHSIMAECKLPADADAQLHILLVEFFGGVKAMRGEADQRSGAVRIIRALQTYPKYFDHADWKPLAH
jgi:hypothetical protein